MAGETLYSIGETAKLFHLSVSSLRHYEALGLVTPEYTDPHTGYRYYSVRQFELFNTIRYLRALDLPLTEIADFLNDRDVGKMEEKLRAQKAAVQAKQQELSRIERKIDARLRQLRDAQSAQYGAIELLQTPARRLFWLEDSVTAQDYTNIELSTSRLTAAQTEALVFLGKVGFSISKAHLTAQQYTRYDGTFLMLDEADHSEGDIMTLPPTLCVRVRFRGHHLQSPAQYQALARYIDAHSLRISGFSREITIIDHGLTKAPEKFVTEITIPVEPISV